MTTADVALLITAIGGSVAAIITALAALKNSNNNSARMAELEKDSERAKGEATMARAEADRLRAADDLKTLHNEAQDAVIVQQQSEIHRWQDAADRMGKKINQLELSIGAMKYEAEQHHPHDTAPLHQPPGSQ